MSEFNMAEKVAKLHSDQIVIDTKDPAPPPALKEPPNSVAQLEKMGFDPLERMGLLWNEMEQLTQDMTQARGVFAIDEDGKTKAKYSVHAHINLIGVKQKLLNDLMRYKYAPVPTVQEEAPKQQGGITIVLCNDNKAFSIVDDEEGNVYDQAP